MLTTNFPALIGLSRGFKTRTFFAAMVLFVSVSAFAQSAVVSVPSAQVTFYTVGVLQSELTDSKHGGFVGHIFDGDSELALMEMGKFVTFSLPPGAHVFSANWKNHDRPDPKVVLSLSLAENQHYYVGVFAATSDLVVVRVSVEQGSCEEASKYAHKAKSLAGKHVDPAHLSLVVSEKSFPQCH